MKKLLALFLILSAGFFVCSPAVAKDGADRDVRTPVDQTISPGLKDFIAHKIIAAYADEFLSGQPNRTIFAEDLVNGTAGPEKNKSLADYFLLDIRPNTDFCSEEGHITGAINIPFQEVAKPENLAQLPKDWPILVICHTGHTASQINSILNLLGYDAWTLRFGMMSWRSATTMKVWSPNSANAEVIYGGGYLDFMDREGCAP